MKSVYIKAEEVEVVLDKELNSYGVGEHFAIEIEEVEYTNDYGTGKLFTWDEPSIDEAAIFNESQAVMVGHMFDIEGNLYKVTWTMKEGYIAEEMELDDFAEWEKPFSIEMVE